MFKKFWRIPNHIIKIANFKCRNADVFVMFYICLKFTFRKFNKARKFFFCLESPLRPSDNVFRYNAERIIIKKIITLAFNWMDSPNKGKDSFLTQNLTQAQRSCAPIFFKLNFYFIWDVGVKKKLSGMDFSFGWVEHFFDAIICVCLKSKWSAIPNDITLQCE